VLTATPPIRRPLAELSVAQRTALLDLSLEEELRELGRAGTPEFRADDGLEWVSGALPGAIVYRTSLEAADADARIAARLADFDARRLAVTWWARPDARPADLRERLVRHGFDLTDDEAGMAADLEHLVEGLPRPAGLAIEVFGRDDALPTDGVEAWLEVAGSSFAWLPERYEVRRRLYHGDPRRPRPWRHAVARLAGRPVAMARVLLAGGVAMVHGVATIESARRQGIGSAITVAVLAAARDEGYRIGVLQASSMGQGPYRRIGFETVARYGRYERPPAQ
jgi:ribosomal protein S18 acetylase RimI-like enzyme